MQPWLNTTMRETVKPRQTEILPRGSARARQPPFSTRGGRCVPSRALPSPARSESAAARKRKERQWRSTGWSAAPRGMLGAERGVLFGISLSEVRFSITSKLWISLLQEPADKQKFLARQVKLVFARYSVHGQGFEVFQHHREIHGFNWTQGIRRKSRFDSSIILIYHFMNLGAVTKLSSHGACSIFRASRFEGEASVKETAMMKSWSDSLGASCELG
ncbi:uncharacterized protein LOC128080301 [Tympanuchus pallidicinctus]|uniref:uncharacterized protein LOC128080301 n=1 Tax=Tympanuchus pallidicinctus TaxID=109042 RepID=UPI00228728C8|nr:uncharacterized protein LOC128080301 [Tympanuchus pallidicinctus]